MSEESAPGPLPAGMAFVERTPKGGNPGDVVVLAMVQRGDIVANMFEWQVLPENREHPTQLLRQQYDRL